MTHRPMYFVLCNRKPVPAGMLIDTKKGRST